MIQLVLIFSFSVISILFAQMLTNKKTVLLTLFSYLTSPFILAETFNSSNIFIFLGTIPFIDRLIAILTWDFFFFRSDFFPKSIFSFFGLFLPIQLFFFLLGLYKVIIGRNSRVITLLVILLLITLLTAAHFLSILLLVTLVSVIVAIGWRSYPHLLFSCLPRRLGILLLFVTVLLFCYSLSDLLHFILIHYPIRG